MALAALFFKENGSVNSTRPFSVERWFKVGRRWNPVELVPGVDQGDGHGSHSELAEFERGNLQPRRTMVGEDVFFLILEGGETRCETKCSIINHQ